jgi:hypothetical protein
MKKTLISKYQKTTELYRNTNPKSKNIKIKLQNTLSRNKTFRNTIGNPIFNDKIKPKLQSVNSENSINRNKNLLLSNNFIKIKNKSKLIKKVSTSLIKKDNKIIIEKKSSKTSFNSNSKEKNSNKIIKEYSSYAKTAVSTTNNINDNVININFKKNENILKKLIDNINLKEIEKVSNVDLLQNNIFLLKVYSFIFDLTSKDYSILNIEHNNEIKQQFKELTNKIEFLNNNKLVNNNLININIIYDKNCNLNEKMNNILQESNNRKLIYNNFFDFYEKILCDIVKLSNELSKKNLNKKNEEIASINSNINFIKSINREKHDNELLNNLNIKETFSQGDYNIYYGMDESNGISSIDNDYYQILLKNSFKEKNINNENSKSKNHSRNKQLNNNFSSLSSTIINNYESSDSNIIDNISINNNNSLPNKNNSNKKNDIKKKMNIPDIEQKFIEENKNEFNYHTQSKDINNKVQNLNIKKNFMKTVKNLDKPMIKEKIMNRLNNENDKCNIF